MSTMIDAPRQIDYERVTQVARTKTAGLMTYDVRRSEKPTKRALMIVPGVTGHSQERYIMDLAD
jgi:hypothetical protein